MASLPTLPDPDVRAIHIHNGDDKLGPIDRHELAARIMTGSLSQDCHFWFDGMAEWAAISDHPSLLQVNPKSKATPPRSRVAAMTQKTPEPTSNAEKQRVKPSSRSTASKSTQGNEGPSPEWVHGVIDRHGMARAVDLIRQETGWDFQRSARHLASVLGKR